MNAPARSTSAMARFRAWQLRECASFTLVEMMISAAVAILLVIALATMAVSFFNSTGRVKSVTRSSQDARFAMEVMCRELEGIYRERDGSTNEWFNYTNLAGVGPAGGTSPNAGQMLFFSTADDRSSTNGDLCALRYVVGYQTLGSGTNSSFVIDRTRIDPASTLTNVWGLPNLTTYWSASANAPGDADFFAENVAEMWINVGFNQAEGSPATNALVVAQAPSGVRFSGTGFTVYPANPSLQTGAQPAYVEVYLRVLDEAAQQGLYAGRSLKSVTNADSQILSRKVFLPAQ